MPSAPRARAQPTGRNTSGSPPRRSKPFRRARLKATVKYDPGTDPAAAAAAAKGADVAIVFAYQWESEGMDLPNLSLPDNQDAIIAAVAAANPHTIVVLETGSPVTMPWVDAAGRDSRSLVRRQRRRKRLGNVLFGTVNPSGKLPNTFPKSVKPTCRTRPSSSRRRSRPLRWPGLAGAVGRKGCPPSRSTYDEGVKVGYKWYDAEKKPCSSPSASASPTPPTSTPA
jgi:beta-glucosidase